MTESKKMDSVQKLDNKARFRKVEGERARLREARLRVVCFHTPEDLWKRFKVKLARDRLTVRQVTEAMIELYVKGGFNVEEKSDQADKK